MGSYPVTFGGQTFTSADFSGHNYVHGFPSLLQAANQAISERVGLTFSVDQNISPMIGPLMVQAPVGLPIIANTLLSFAVDDGGSFLMRVGRYDPDTGALSGQVVLVRNHQPATRWTVGMDRMVDVADVDDGGSGLWLPDQMPLARQQLGLPGIGLTRIQEDFHQGYLPEGWSVWTVGAPFDPLFPNDPQWDGVGTYQSRSYMRLSSEGVTSTPRVVVGPAVRVASDMSVYLAIRKSPDAGLGFVGFHIEMQDFHSSAWSLTITPSGTTIRLGDFGNPSQTVSAVGTQWEHWEFHTHGGAPCQAIRNGVEVHSVPAYPQGVGRAHPSLRTPVQSGVTDQYLDIDYFYVEVPR